MRYLKESVIILLVFVIFLCTACMHTDQGNTSTDFGLSYNAFELYGDLIYYRDVNNGKIYKTNTNEENIKICDDSVFFFNIYEDWIYYSNADDKKRLYKIKTNGREQTKLSSSDYSGIEISKMDIIDGWIYFISDSHGYKLCKMKTDGTQFTEISQQVCVDMSILDEWIYYLVQKKNDFDGYYLYRMPIDGEEENQLTDIKSYVFDYDYTWIYYVDNVTPGVYKIKYDGSENQMLTEGSCIWLKVVDDYVYYTKGGADNGIYKVSINGSEPMKISDDAPEVFIDIWKNSLLYYYSGEPGSIKTSDSDEEDSVIENLVDF